MRAPSEKKLLEAFRDLTPKDAKLIRKFAKDVDDRDKLEDLVEKVPATSAYVRSLYSDPYRLGIWRITVALHAIDQLMGGYGVEALGPISMREGPPYEYVNFGDPYTTTLIYDRDKDRLFIGAWGDIPEVENNEWEDNPSPKERRKIAKEWAASRSPAGVKKERERLQREAPLPDWRGKPKIKKKSSKKKASRKKNPGKRVTNVRSLVAKALK